MKFHIRLDVCTLCNLNCASCYMRKNKNNEKSFGLGYLKFETFKKFIDENKDYIDDIEISNNGEALINPDIIPILKYAYENNIGIRCENGTNLSFKNDELLKALVDYNVLGITVSCDGVKQETYEQYRINGNVETVLDNIKKIQDYKKLKNSIHPHIFWQYIIRKSTENDVELAIQKAKELDVDLVFKLTWEKDYIPSPDKVDKLVKLTGLKKLTRGDFQNSTGAIYTPTGIPICLQLWNQLAINWDGRLVGCCTNKHPFNNINVFEIGIKELLNNEEYINTKKWLLNEIDNIDSNNPCYRCNKSANFKMFTEKYKQLINENRW